MYKSLSTGDLISNPYSNESNKKSAFITGIQSTKNISLNPFRTTFRDKRLKIEKRYEQEMERIRAEQYVSPQEQMQILLNKEIIKPEFAEVSRKIFRKNYSEIFQNKLKKHKNEIMKYRYCNYEKLEKLNNRNINNPYLKKLSTTSTHFGRTKYQSQDAIKSFFNKFRNFNDTIRKNPIEKITPSVAFIESTKKQKIIPNPLGLIKRNRSVKDEEVVHHTSNSFYEDSTKRDYDIYYKNKQNNPYEENVTIDLSNAKVGDPYIISIGKSVQYMNNLKEIVFPSNRITEIGTMSLFESINNNNYLISKILKINLGNNKIGDSGADSLEKFLSDDDCVVENLNIENNLLGDKNIYKIAKAIIDVSFINFTYINFSKNNISDDGAIKISGLAESCQNLKVLILSYNKIHNEGASAIQKKLIKNSSLKVYDISWNCIGKCLLKELTYEELVNEDKDSKRLYRNFEIEENLKTGKYNFKLNPYNQKNREKVILEMIKTNNPRAKDYKEDIGDRPNKKKRKVEVKKVLKPIIIDVKPKEPTQFAKILAEYFNNKEITLLHLDISHNNLTFEDCKLISKEIKNNHTILGTHVDGNEMTINSLGFITPIAEDIDDNYFPKSQLCYGFDKITSIRKTRNDNIRKLRNLNNCWICEKWREVEFKYKPTDEKLLNNPNDSLVRLHLDFDNWEEFEMTFNGTYYSAFRMCPPGFLKYFITVDTTPVDSYSDNIVTIGKNEKEISYSFPEKYIDELYNTKIKIYEKNNTLDEEFLKKTSTALKFFKKTGSFSAPETSKNTSIVSTMTDLIGDKVLKDIKVNTFGKKYINENIKMGEGNWDKNLKVCVPRPEKIKQDTNAQRIPWKYPISIWAKYDYQFEGYSDEYIGKCFENDFNRCQFEKEFKDTNSYNEAKQLLRKHYRDILDCYKNLSSFCGFTLWQVTQNVLTDWVNKCPGLCDKKYDINNVYLTQTAICANLLDKEDRIKNNNKNLSDNLVRHQFMALLVKVSKDKYIRILRTMENTLSAFKYSLNAHFLPAIQGFDCHKWRMERYYNEENDNFIKAFFPVLDGLFKAWAAKKGPLPIHHWMNLEEFNNFVLTFADANEYPVRENPLIFNISLQLQVNELEGDKHIHMYLPEFLEAFFRALDKANPIPPGEKIEDWPMNRRVEQPLVKKAENVIELVVRKTSHVTFRYIKEKFPFPSKNPNTNLYMYDLENPFYKKYGSLLDDKIPKKKLNNLYSSFTTSKSVKNFNS